VVLLNLGSWGGFQFYQKRFAAAILLTSGTLAWFFLLQYNISDMFLNSSNPILGYVNPFVFYGFAATSAIGGIMVRGKVDNRVFLLSWIALGVLSTILLPIFQQTEFMPFLSILLGLSLGLGLPSSIASIADRTSLEERGRVSGVTIFVTFGLAILVMISAEIFSLELSTLMLLFALVRSSSFLAFLLDKFDGKNKVEQGTVRRPDHGKDFYYYIIPWLMFILVGMLAWNLIPPGTYSSAVSTGQVLRFICIAVFGFVSGVAADRFGRKPSVIIGLVILGISLGVLGYAISELTVITYLTASGITWGAFLATYLAIPGDLSVCGSREKYYALIIGLPLILLGSVPFIPGLAGFTMYSSSFSQILSLILFLSIVPVLRAKETLPERSIGERRLREHIKKVGELVEETEKAAERKMKKPAE